MMTDKRSISTVLDVALALVLISASILMLYTFLGSEDTRSQPIRADQTAETLAATSISIDYSMAEATEDEYNENISLPEDSYVLDRSAHGPATGVLADVAVINAEFWGTRYSSAGVGFERSVNGAILGAITGLNHSVRVEAVWRPHRGSGIVGEASAGQAVPPDADINSVTFNAPSGVGNVSDELEANYEANGEFDDAGEVLAEAIVDQFLPPDEKQRALESSSARRQFALYQYNRMSRVMDEIHDEEWDDDRVVDPEDDRYPFTPDEELDRDEANALWLNQYMVEQTLANRIADDLGALFDGEPTVEELIAAVSVEDVELTVRTWETND